MNRKFRLTKSGDYLRVKRSGKSFAHPLIVLVVAPNVEGQSRFGIVVGRSLGKAVQRNRIKRLLREAIRTRLARVQPGWDVVVIARSVIRQATISEIGHALDLLFERAQLLVE